MGLPVTLKIMLSPLLNGTNTESKSSLEDFLGGGGQVKQVGQHLHKINALVFVE